MLPTILVLSLFSAFQLSNLWSFDAQIGAVLTQPEEVNSVDNCTYEVHPTVFSAHFEE